MYTACNLDDSGQEEKRNGGKLPQRRISKMNTSLVSKTKLHRALTISIQQRMSQLKGKIIEKLVENCIVYIK